MTNLNKKVKSKRILVLVVKYRHRAIVLLYTPIHQVPTTSVKDTADLLIENRKLTFHLPRTTTLTMPKASNAGSAMKNEAEN